MPGGTNVYNVTFRSYQQESRAGVPDRGARGPGIAPALRRRTRRRGRRRPNTSPWPSAGTCGWRTTRPTRSPPATSPSTRWRSTGRSCRRSEDTPEPQPTGYTNRWYASPLTLGEGVVDAEGTTPTRARPTSGGCSRTRSMCRPATTRQADLADVDPALARRQPQPVRRRRAHQLQEECQERESICATTEGFSDGQWYYGAAEVDFWDVWHQLAEDYDLNPDTTVMSGYSMGGFASYKLALEYPDLFAQAMPLEGPVICGNACDAAGRKRRRRRRQCTSDGNTTPLIVNAKWIPYVMTYGAIDELVLHRRPRTGRSLQQARLPLLRGAVPGRGPHGVRRPERLRAGDLPARAPSNASGPGLVHLHLVSGTGLELTRDRAERRLLGERAAGTRQRPASSRA